MKSKSKHKPVPVEDELQELLQRSKALREEVKEIIADSKELIKLSRKPRLDTNYPAFRVMQEVSRRSEQ